MTTSNPKSADELVYNYFAEAAFTKLVDGGAQQITLFVFNFGGEHGRVAWRTDLGPAVVDMVKRWVSRQSGGDEKAAASPVSASELREYAAIVKSVLPSHLGFALFIGTGDAVGYVSSAERADVITTLRDDLLADWTRAVATLPERRAKAQGAHAGLATEAARLGEARLAGLVLPPPTSPGNLETLFMSWAYLYVPLSDAFLKEPDSLHDDDAFSELRTTAFGKKLALLRPKFLAVTELFDTQPEYYVFARLWLESAWARLEVGHKLAASLCFTDVPEDLEVRAPWKAWSLVVPDGLFPDPAPAIGEPPDPKLGIARLWCIGTKPIAGIGRSGRHIVSFADFAAETGDEALGERAEILRRSYTNLVRGACLALSNPDVFKKELHHRPSSRSQQKSRRQGAPDLAQAKFLLSAPVKVDLREHLREVLSERHRSGSGTIKAQFLVRGHWREQAHGPRHSQRKTLWIEPFWKGDPGARVLLRPHKA